MNPPVPRERIIQMLNNFADGMYLTLDQGIAKIAAQYLSGQPATAERAYPVADPEGVPLVVLLRSMAAANIALKREGTSALLHQAADEIARLGQKSDAEMERVKACEHIADGDEGWETLRNLCPSAAAVARLRTKHDMAVVALKDAERFLDYFANHRATFSGPGTPFTALALVQAALKL